MWIIFANAQLIKAPFHDVTFKKLQFELEGAIMKFLSFKAIFLGKSRFFYVNHKKNQRKQQFCFSAHNQNFSGYIWLKVSDVNSKKYWMFPRIFSYFISKIIDVRYSATELRKCSNKWI